MVRFRQSSVGLFATCTLLCCSCDAQSASGSEDCTAGRWVDRAALSVARQETGAARLDETVYVVGGLLAGPPLTATATVEAYDIASDSWSSVPDMPVALDHAAVAAGADKLFVMGGFSGNFAARDETWIYDPVGGSWSAGPDLPEPRGACWAVAHGSNIYLFGGIDSGFNVRNSTFILDTTALEWTTGQNMPTAREHLTAAALGDFIYVIGGRSGSATAANERYHPASDAWTVLQPMPTARSATATAAFDARIYVAGGEVPQLFDVHEAYDIATDSWTCVASMPVPRHGVAAVALDDCILAPGGGIIQGLDPTTHVDCYFPPPQEAPAVSAVGLAQLAIGLGLAGLFITRVRNRK